MDIDFRIFSLKILYMNGNPLKSNKWKSCKRKKKEKKQEIIYIKKRHQSVELE